MQIAFASGVMLRAARLLVPLRALFAALVAGMATPADPADDTGVKTAARSRVPPFRTPSCTSSR
ncbi:hypothetical protein EJK15_61165 [Nonomuraea basaltis]|nr:hypothetical protein EJK15_61165 [Nonomuraea basaltis]